MDDQALDELTRLLVENTCRRLVLEAAAAVDAAKYCEFAALFAQGGTLQRPGGQGLVGSEEIVASYTARASDRVTRHLILGSLFTHVSRDAASAVTDVIVWSGSLADQVGPLGRPARTQAVGRFTDDFVLCAVGWRISKRAASFDLFCDRAQER